jgi:hypothetical protein
MKEMIAQFAKADGKNIQAFQIRTPLPRPCPCSVSYENATNEKDERYVWLPPNVVDRLRFLRGPSESYSDVILRLVAAGEGIEA